MSSTAATTVYREVEPDIEQRLQTAYEKGRADERTAIRNEVQFKGYEWSHDPNTSGVQHVINYLWDRARNHD